MLSKYKTEGGFATPCLFFMNPNTEELKSLFETTYNRK